MSGEMMIMLVGFGGGCGGVVFVSRVVMSFFFVCDRFFGLVVGVIGLSV